MIVGDLSGSIFRLASVFVTVSRGMPGTDDGAGHYTPNTPTTFTVQANIQPTSGRDLQRLPEAFRTKEIIKLFSRDALQTEDSNAGTPADLVTFNGLQYEVQSVQPWPHGNLYESLAAKVGA